MFTVKITFMPKTPLGKAASACTIIFIVLLLLKMGTGFPLATFAIAGIGVVGFVLGIAAIIRKDRSVGSFISVLAGLGIIFVFGTIWFGSLGLFKDFPVKDSLTQAEAGDALDRTANLGTISESGGWVYYIYESGLYKRKTDWTEKTKITDSEVSSIFISDGWVYYSGSGGNGLYKIKTDGTGQVKTSSDSVNAFTAAGDWIFYTTSEKYESKEQPAAGATTPLYRIKTDGTDKTKLADIAIESGGPKLQGDWVYYSAKGNLYKMKGDGTEQTLIADGAGIDYVYGDWVYYVSRSDEGQGLEKVTVNRIKTDGTEKIITAEISGVYIFTFDGDWLYYTTFKETDRLKLDGTGKEKLNNVQAWGLMGVAGNWMYINDYEGPMWRVKLDGSVGTRIN
jgi:hypothetical protein